MSIERGELLDRLAATLRSDIGPAIADDYARTQAFMAAVILERVGRELALGPRHEAAVADDLAELGRALEPILAEGPEPVRSAHRNLQGATIDAVGPLIQALYRWGADEPAVVEALAVVRPVLRRDIDRRMEIAQ